MFLLSMWWIYTFILIFEIKLENSHNCWGLAKGSWYLTTTHDSTPHTPRTPSNTLCRRQHTMACLFSTITDDIAHDQLTLTLPKAGDSNSVRVAFINKQGQRNQYTIDFHGKNRDSAYTIQVLDPLDNPETKKRAVYLTPAGGTADFIHQRLDCIAALENWVCEQTHANQANLFKFHKPKTLDQIRDIFVRAIQEEREEDPHPSVKAKIDLSQMVYRNKTIADATTADLTSEVPIITGYVKISPHVYYTSTAFGLTFRVVEMYEIAREKKFGELVDFGFEMFCSTIDQIDERKRGIEGSAAEPDAKRVCVAPEEQMDQTAG